MSEADENTGNLTVAAGGLPAANGKLSRGKLIVIEGIDGSGKSTQLRRLTKRLTKEGFDFQSVRFPRYSEEHSALVRMYLSGDLGKAPGDVNAYAASSFFAADRFASYKKEPWGAYYDGGGTVFADRYTTSNAIHQGVKLPRDARADFFRWLYDYEFRLLGLPAPSVVFHLALPVSTALSRIGSRGGEKDIHERDTEYLAACAECAAEAAETLGWINTNAARSVNEIHTEIYTAAVRILREVR
ncbi:MAG: thymidylate kinase [Oscillospiraceae bacterium]|jgi:dTMP kinase|nr:thymidylate kinase [Oscillospiraceae bacterium]